MLIGTKMKWYPIVNANWMRASVSASMRDRHLLWQTSGPAPPPSDRRRPDVTIFVAGSTSCQSKPVVRGR